MKKLTLLTIGVFLAVLAMAQNTNHQKYGKNGYNHMPVPRIEKKAKSNASKSIIWEENFDDGTISDWTLYDEDGDGQDWATATYATPISAACLTSASWTSTGGALTPNNWAVTPAIDLTSVEGAPFIDFTTWAQDQSWTSEHYKVMVSVTDNSVASFTDNIFEETLPGTGTFNRVLPLGDYVGETIYIAFVHYDCTDMYQLNLDDISVYASTEVNLGITEILAPNNESSCELTNAEEVTVTLANVGGLDATGFEVSYTIEGENGTETVTEIFGDVLAAGATVNYTFTQTADLSTLGYYTISYEVTIADDVDMANNTLEQDVSSADGTLIVSALSDMSGGQTWTLANSAGDVVASFTNYQWGINKDIQVCILDDDCYTFEFSGFDETGWVELIYNGVTVAGGQTPGNTTGGVTWFGIGGGCAAVDAKLDAITTPDVVEAGEVDISGRLLNMGADDITSFDVVYSIDGGEESAVYSVSGVQIATGDVHNFTHDTPYEFTDQTSSQITVTISNINGAEDANLANNTLTKDIAIALGSTSFMPLFEHFTASSCPPCATVNSTVFTPQFIEDNMEVGTVIRYQVNWPGAGDPYYTEEVGTRVSYYGVSAVPSVFLNGSTQTLSSTAALQANLDAEAAKLAYFEMNATHDVDVEGQSISLDIDITPYLTGDGYTVHAVVIENETYDNASTNGETEFQHVTMKMVPGATGTDVDFVAGEIETLQFIADLSGTNVEEFTDLSVVTFIQKNDSKQIFQSAYSVEAGNEMYTVNFDVSDGQSQLEGATVTIAGNELITNVNGEASVNLADGTYNYTVSKDGYGDVTEEVTVEGADVDVLVEMTGATMLTKAKLQVYPNPSNGVFSVTVDGVYSIRVLNNLGQVAYEAEVDANSTIDLSDLAAGMYVVSVRNNTKTATQTIIIR